MVLSLTRLRLHHWRSLLEFRKLSAACIEQAKADRECLGGATYFGPGLTFWTATLWRSESAMNAYIRSGAHLTALPRLKGWCSEACTAHLSTESTSLPIRAELPGLLSRRAKFFPLENPSALQQSRVFSPRAPWLRQVFKE